MSYGYRLLTDSVFTKTGDIIRTKASEKRLRMPWFDHMVCDFYYSSAVFEEVTLFNREIIKMMTRVTTKIPNMPFPIMGREFKKASMFKFIYDSFL